MAAIPNSIEMAKFAEWVTKFAIDTDVNGGMLYRNIIDQSEIGVFEGDYIVAVNNEETAHFTFLRAAVKLWEDHARDNYFG